MRYVGRYLLCIGALAGSVACSTSPPAMTASGASSGGTVTVSWRAPTANTNGMPLTDLAGYTIVYGMDPFMLTKSARVDSATATSYTLQNLAPGVWYFAVSAYNRAGVQGLRSRVIRARVKR
jgi:hypothetical protein